MGDPVHDDPLPMDLSTVEGLTRESAEDIKGEIKKTYEKRLQKNILHRY